MTFPEPPKNLRDLVELGRWLLKLPPWAKALAGDLLSLLEPEVHQMNAASAIGASWDVVEYTGPGGETIPLPSASRTRPLRFINSGGAAVTLAAQSGQTVAGAATMSVNTASLTDLQGNGALAWRCVGGAFRATSLVLSSVLDVTGQVTLRGLTVWPGATTGGVVTVGLIGDLRQIVFGTSNAVSVGSQTVGGGLSIGTTNAELIGFHGVAPIARPILATGTGKTVDDVITVLQTRGLVRQS